MRKFSFSVLCLFVLISVSGSYAGFCNGIHDYVWGMYLKDTGSCGTGSIQVYSYSPSSYANILTIYHNATAGQIVIEVDVKTSPDWGTFVYTYDPQSIPAIEAAKSFLQDLLLAKANSMKVRFMKVSSGNFII